MNESGFFALIDESTVLKLQMRMRLYFIKIIEKIKTISPLSGNTDMVGPGLAVDLVVDAVVDATIGVVVVVVLLVVVAVLLVVALVVVDPVGAKVTNV